VTLYVHAWGDGPTVVCLHGVTSSGVLFERLASHLPYRLLAPDLRGHGRSTWEPPWRIEQHLADLGELFEEPSAWIGHSFGGRLVIELAARRPELVERAVLLDPAIRVRPDNALSAADDTQPSPAYGRSAVVATFGELAAWGPPPEEIRVPTLLVLPVDGSVVGPRQLARYERGVHDLQIVHVPGGHDVLVDAFEETARAVSEFLAAA
jgi:lipase